MPINCLNRVFPVTYQDAIENFEMRYGVSLPKDLKSLIKQNNGGRPSFKYYDLPGEPDREFKSLLSFNPSDVETVYKSFPLDAADKSLIPFASDSAGNKFVVKDGRIWLLGHEQDALTFVAETISQFLDALHA